MSTTRALATTQRLGTDKVPEAGHWQRPGGGGLAAKPAPGPNGELEPALGCYLVEPVPAHYRGFGAWAAACSTCSLLLRSSEARARLLPRVGVWAAGCGVWLTAASPGHLVIVLCIPLGLGSSTTLRPVGNGSLSLTSGVSETGSWSPNCLIGFRCRASASTGKIARVPATCISVLHASSSSPAGACWKQMMTVAACVLLST